MFRHLMKQHVLHRLTCALAVAALASILTLLGSGRALASNGASGRAQSSRGVDYVSYGTSGNMYVYNVPSGRWWADPGHHVESLYVVNLDRTTIAECGIAWCKNERNPDPPYNILPYASLGYYFTHITAGGNQYEHFNFGGPTTSGAWIPIQVYNFHSTGDYIFTANGGQLQDVALDFGGTNPYSEMATDQTRTDGGYDSYFIDANNNHVGDLRGSATYLKIMPVEAFNDWNYGRPIWPGYVNYAFRTNHLLDSNHWGYVYGADL